MFLKQRPRANGPLSRRSINDPLYTTLSLSLSLELESRVGTFNPANNINYAAPSIIQSFVLKSQTALPFPNGKRANEILTSGSID